MKKQAIELPEHDEENKEGDLHNSSPDHHDDHSYDAKKGRSNSYSQNDYDQDNDLIEIRDGYGEMPMKTIVLTAFLLITGLGFIIASFISFMNQSDRGKILTFLLFGIFLSIPGCYYSVYLFKAFRADSPEERAEILDEIPV